MPTYQVKPASPFIQYGHPTAAGAACVYPLIDLPGTKVARDVSGANYHLTAVGSPTWVSGPYGQQVSGFTTSNYFTKTGMIWPASPPWWIASLFVDSSTQVGYTMALGNTAGSTGFGMFLNGTSAGTLNAFIRNNTASGGIQIVLSSTPSVPANNGQPHVGMLVSYGFNDWRLFFDGVQITQSTTSVSGFTLNTLSIGAINRGAIGSPFGGSVIATAAGYNSVPDPLLLATNWLRGQFSMFRVPNVTDVRVAAIGAGQTTAGFGSLIDGMVAGTSFPYAY